MYQYVYKSIYVEQYDTSLCTCSTPVQHVSTSPQRLAVPERDRLYLQLLMQQYDTAGAVSYLLLYCCYSCTTVWNGHNVTTHRTSLLVILVLYQYVRRQDACVTGYELPRMRVQQHCTSKWTRFFFFRADLCTSTTFSAKKRLPVDE